MGGSSDLLEGHASFGPRSVGRVGVQVMGKASLPVSRKGSGSTSRPSVWRGGCSTVPVIAIDQSVRLQNGEWDCQ